MSPGQAFRDVPIGRYRECQYPLIVVAASGGGDTVTASCAADEWWRIALGRVAAPGNRRLTVQWEYLVVERTMDSGELATLGAEGWELVAVVSPAHFVLHYFFKREARA
jgi:hypothetical protein